ncbi:MAG TPA: arginine--tRNA ligase, partial [Candidatus Kryptobacter bacterium]|nr:arginine--tRNA ligase [Candidatus Kryptobacter bacterium]
MKDYLKAQLLSALEKAGFSGGTTGKIPVEISFDKPKIESHGDLSTNFALLAAKELKMKPRDVAQKIVEALDVDPSLVEKTDV